MTVRFIIWFVVGAVAMLVIVHLFGDAVAGPMAWMALGALILLVVERCVEIL
jgi:cell division protein FtsW (lipid II flippase)